MKDKLQLIVIVGCFGSISGWFLGYVLGIDLPPLIGLCLILSILGLFIG